MISEQFGAVSLLTLLIVFPVFRRIVGIYVKNGSEKSILCICCVNNDDVNTVWPVCLFVSLTASVRLLVSSSWTDLPHHPLM